MKDLCTGCDDRDACVKLCKEAEEWASQDKVEKHWRMRYVGSLDRLDWLANHVSTLTLQEMQNEVELNLEDWKALKDCKLTKQQMQCMYLYYWEEDTQKEIGEKLGIKQQVVSQHIEYAKKKLTKMLKS